MPELIHITAPTFQNAVHFIKKKKKKVSTLALFRKLFGFYLSV